MKQFLLVDLAGDYQDIMSYKDLKNMVVDHIVEDTLDNLGDESIVRTNTSLLEEMIKKETTMSFIEEELRCYSYKVINLLDLQRDLEDIKSYFLNKKEYVGDICETIELINKEMNKNE